MSAKETMPLKLAFGGKTAQLQHLCSAITDCHHSTPNWLDSGHIVVRSENIKRGKISLQKVSYTDGATFQERIARSVPEAGDLIVTREAPMGEVGMIPDGVQCCLGQRLVLVKPDSSKINRHYLLYAMQSEFVQKQIGASDETGSTVSNLRIPALKELLIPLLDRAEEIGAILSALDAKIDLNNRINAELEALVKTIYDYWFVQFDFPDAHGRPYKSSGGAMVWNDTLKREIPAGWDTVPLEVLVDVVKEGVSPASLDAATPYVGLEHISRKSIALSDWSRADMATSQKTAFRSGDILFGKIRPYFHKVALASFDGVASTDAIIMRPRKPDFAGLALETIFSNEFVDAATASSTGSKMPRADWSVMRNYCVAVPGKSSETLATYQDLFQPIAEKIASHVRQNRELTQLRDWLLPLLMNGQVRVS